MTTVHVPLRIGEVAERVGTTPRTVRYYEEIGLLPGSGERRHGQHRLYGEADVERLEQILRLKQLLGLTLDELKQLIEAEDARAELRERWRRADDADGAARSRILSESLGHIARQLELVRGRKRELERLEEELTKKQRRVRDLLRRIEA
jgi:DNA-binding transcriptional MerR regulator